MEVSKIIDMCNRGNIASDFIRAPEIYNFLDKVINDINDRLQATYPTMTSFVTGTWVDDWNALHPEAPYDRTNYNLFPALYIERVFPVGVARYFYMKDEEGEVVASDYFRTYEQALFQMVRDYHSQVPDAFQNNEGGFVDFKYETEKVPGLTPRGIVFDGSEFRL